MLESKGVKFPKAWKTGTTIAGIIFKDGVVLGADTRSTSGSTVADKNCKKIHYITPNIYCCGAGTAADLEHVTDMISGQMELHRYSTGRESRVVTVMTLFKQHLFKYQGHIGAALVLGGVDLNGPHLFTIYPHGSTDCLPFATMGSGSLNAMAMFEAYYKEDLNRQEAIDLVARAIRSGVMNDLGSGSNVDIMVITKEGTENLRNYEYLQARPYVRQFPPRFSPTPILKEKVMSLQNIVVTEGVPDNDAMDLS